MGDVNFGPFGVSGVEAAEDERCSSREECGFEWLDWGLDVESGASSNVSCWGVSSSNVRFVLEVTHAFSVRTISTRTFARMVGHGQRNHGIVSRGR